MSSLPIDDIDDGDELDDDDIPTVEIPDFDPAELDDLDTLFEGHPVIELLTPESKVRIILTLLRVRGDKLRACDIYERARISHDTWYKHKDTLLNKYQIIEEVGSVGNSPLYRINEDNELVDRFDALIGVAGDRKREWLVEQQEQAD
jgi:hypothetical protein